MLFRSRSCLRPIFHRKQERTQAHILVCFLALTMWRTLQQWMKTSGLGTAPRKLLEELRELKSLDVLLPTREKNLRLRMVATPEKELKVLLQRMKILLPNKPKIIENVVRFHSRHLFPRKANSPDSSPGSVGRLQPLHTCCGQYFIDMQSRRTYTLLQEWILSDHPDTMSGYLLSVFFRLDGKMVRYSGSKK